MLKFIKKLEKLDYRVHKINVDIKFLKSSLENDLCPAFLRYKMSSKRLQNSESYIRSHRLFLQEEISFKTIDREKFIREMQLIRDDLRTVMIFLDWVHISNKFIEGNIKTIKRVEEVQNYKLAELLSSKLEHDPQKSHS